MGHRSWILVISVLAAVMLAPAARADDWAACTNANPDVSIFGCSAIIEAGTETQENIAVARHNRGLAYQNKGDQNRAIADFDKAIELRPGDARAYFNRGFSHFFKADYDRAIADFDRAIVLNPKDAVFFNFRCWVRAVAGTNLDEARRDCDAALALSNNATYALESRGLVGIKQLRFEEAWADFDAALRTKPDEASFLYGRGIAALRLGRASEGTADMDNAIRLDPNIAKTFVSLGVSP